ncbi:ABC transporter ATP-binding protein [Staphylospora marina]|uniref:ABC transporter ATP-binding protein n=1 Tax=Staphylospora marina TaxID=2490858 RepID=UPI000F5B9DE4|nr:ABC transporter ATP-binding protein [Staphylospora marina]
MEEALIKTDELTKVYNRQRVVDGLNLEVRRGTIYGFLGPNGAGKTTTIRMLLGLVRPTGGTVHMFGQEFSNNRLSILKRVGSLVETPSYYGQLTGYENLEVARKLYRIPDKNRIDEALSLVGLEDARNKKVKQYSLGMKQRLGLATALLNNPDLLILDEPTNGLDPAGIREMRDLIKRLPRERGVTILLSSHLLSEVEQIADDVGIIHKGKLLFQGSLESLRKHTRSRTVIEVDRPEDAAKLLKEHGFSVHLEEGLLVLPTSEAENTLREIQRLLVQDGFIIRRLEEERPPLENIFLNLVEAGDSPS